MRLLHLLTAGSALLLLTACGGSSTPAASAPLTSDSTAPASSEPSLAGASTAASPAPRRTRAAASPAAASPAPTPARTTAPRAEPSVKPTPKPSPQPSPRPSPRPSPTKAPSPAPPPGPTHALEMTTGYKFSPMDLTIGVGDAVRAHNSDTMDHTFTGSTWDSGNVAPGAYARVFRFNTAGTFHFVCTPHEGLGMTGTLTVK